MATYKIESGDTLTSIAKKYNTTVDAIASANGITNKNLIRTGATLTIPETTGQMITVTNKLPITGEKVQKDNESEIVEGTAENKIAKKAESVITSEPPKQTISTSKLANEVENWKSRRPVSPVAEYDDDIKSLVASLVGMDFSYDPSTDDIYNLVSDENRKNARRAMEDTLGKALTMTGGYSNTFAQGAAQQAYANELSKTTELIPELFEAAYDRFTDERDSVSDSIKLLSELDNAEFDKYTDLLKQYLTEGEMLFDNYKWSSEEELDRFLDYASLLQKASK